MAWRPVPQRPVATLIIIGWWWWWWMRWLGYKGSYRTPPASASAHTETRRCVQILHRATQNILYWLHEKMHILLWDFRYIALRSAAPQDASAHRDVLRRSGESRREKASLMERFQEAPGDAARRLASRRVSVPADPYNVIRLLVCPLK
jgi:hypothetical protein